MRYNVEITLRERGKIVARRSTHNLWLDTGRSWLGHLVSDQSDDRIRYVGFGIGGVRQNDYRVNIPPLSGYSPMGPSTDGTDVSIIAMNRPVRFNITDYLKQITSVEYLTPYCMRYSLYVGGHEITYDPSVTYFYDVPLSEVGLFLNGVSITAARNEPLAYDVFDPVVKHESQDMTIRWTLRLT